jgi:hypothetical protein
MHSFLWIFTAVFPLLTQNYINKLQNRQKRILFEKMRFSHLVRKFLSCCGKRIFFPAFTGFRWWTPLYKTPSNSKVLEILRKVSLSTVKLSSPSHLRVLQATYWNPPCRAAGRFLRPQPDTAPCYGEQEPTQRASECFCYRICHHEWICSSDEATENMLNVVSYRI